MEGGLAQDKLFFIFANDGLPEVSCVCQLKLVVRVQLSEQGVFKELLLERVAELVALHHLVVIHEGVAGGFLGHVGLLEVLLLDHAYFVEGGSPVVLLVVVQGAHFLVGGVHATIGLAAP